jgi:hypothetical protein
MRSPEPALAQLRLAWRRHAGQWLGGAGEWPLSISLQVPREQQAAQDWTAFDDWRVQWRSWSGAGEVDWTERRWPQLGRQGVPAQWRLRDAAEAAQAMGELPRWQRAEQRFQVLVERWPTLESRLRSQFELLADIEESEFTRMRDMLAWLLAHPASQLFARQLPVAGLDSKWLETRIGVIGGWLRQLTGTPDDAGFWSLSGLRREPDRLRLRVLDPSLRDHVGGLGDIHAPWQQLAELDWSVRRVFIVENKQTGLAFDELPGAVVLMARGYAVEQLAQLPWLRAAEAVHYWGDIDTHGLAILGRLRGHLPSVRSLLMDEVTLHAHRALCVAEPEPHRAEAIEHLSGAEQALYCDLRGDRWGVRLRLEQERIGWDYAWKSITDVVCG